MAHADPAPAEQLAFLGNIQRLLTEGQYVASYKFALLIALADLAVELGRDDSAPLALTTHQIAEKFIGLYWQQTVPYVQHIGLWDGKDFQAIGIILAETSCTYKAAIAYGQPVRVGVRAARLGTKSLEFHYSIQDAGTGEEMATGRSIQVAYDYLAGHSIPIPAAWRAAITAFDGLTPEQGGAAA